MPFVKANQKPLANTKITKNILNQIQTITQNHKNNILDKCQGDYKKHSVKFEASLKNPKDHPKCTPPPPQVFNFKLYLPQRINACNASHQRNDALQFEQNELHNKKKKEAGCDLATFHTRNWKEMERNKDIVVSHLKTALVTLEEGIATTTIERDFQPVQHCAEGTCIKQIGCNSLNITQCCKGCYSISSRVPSQVDFHHTPVEETLFRDQSIEREPVHLKDSYVNEGQKRNSLLCKNIACLSKHYASHLQHVTTTEDCKHLYRTVNKKKSTPVSTVPKSTTYTSSLSSMCLPTTSSSESKCSFQNSTRLNSDSTPNANTSYICTDGLEISKDCHTEVQKKKSCDIQAICAKDRGIIDLINNGRYMEQNFVKHKKSKYLGNNIGKKETGECESKFKLIGGSKKMNNQIFLAAEKDVYLNQKSNEKSKASSKEEDKRNLTTSSQQRNAKLSSLDKINVEISNLKQELEDITD